MSDFGRLVFQIDGDSSSFDRTYGRVDSKTESLAKQFKKAELSAKTFGEQSSLLAKKQQILRSKLEGLINKGVSPANKGFKKLSKQYREVSKEADKVANKSQGLGMALKAAAAAAAAYGAYKLKQFFSGAVEAASDAAESTQKFGNVYSNSLAKAQEYAQVLKGNANISLSEAKAALATGGAILKSAGFQEQAALSQSNTLARMAGDLKSFHNLSESTEQVMERLLKASLGERESLIEVGLKVGEKDLIDFAAASGKVWKNLNKQEKAQTTINLLMKMTSDSYGDVNKSAGTYAHTQRLLENAQKDLSERVGNELLPALTNLKLALASSAEEGKSTSNTLVKLGKAISFVINLVTSLIKGFDALDALQNRNDNSMKDLTETAEKYRVSTHELGNLVGAASLGLIDLDKEMEKANKSGDKHRITLIKAAQEGYGQYKNATNKSDIAVKEFTDSLKNLDGQVKKTSQGLDTYSTPFDINSKPIDTSSTNKNKKSSGGRSRWRSYINGLRRERDHMVKHYNMLGKTELEKVDIIEQQKLKKVKEFRKRRLISEQQKENLITKVKEEAVAKRKKIEEKQFKNTVRTSIQVANTIASGVSTILSAMSQAQEAATDKKVSMIEEARQRTLEEAGLAEETAVEKAEKELEEVKKKGKKEEIIEKEKALKKAKINEKFNKEKALAEYQGQLQAWEYSKIQAKISLATALMNAVKSGIGAEFPLSLIMPGILSATAIAAYGIQSSALNDAKPQAPKFATGGIVPGNMTTGDRVSTLQNSGEMDINTEQQAALWEFIKNGSTNNKGVQEFIIHNYINVDGENLYTFITRASQRGDIRISDRSIEKF